MLTALKPDCSRMPAVRENVDRIAATFDAHNLAADMGGMGFIARHKTACMLNVLINTHLLMAAVKHRAKKDVPPQALPARPDQAVD